MKQEVTIFRDRVPIDVQTATPGIEFEDPWQKKEVMKYRKQGFYVVSREDLILSLHTTPCLSPVSRIGQHHIEDRVPIPVRGLN